ncbi:hypothetical protein BGZ76_010730 [Entomortierella beljakovae]|nr:hypothetical protein BGZ76_010730 [Entomortierella beljakovae]
MERFERIERLERWGENKEQWRRSEENNMMGQFFKDDVLRLDNSNNNGDNKSTVKSYDVVGLDIEMEIESSLKVKDLDLVEIPLSHSNSRVDLDEFESRQAMTSKNNNNSDSEIVDIVSSFV